MRGKETDWLSNYLYFIGRKYPFVLMDLLESYILDKRDIQIMIERYINHKTIDEISLLVHVESRQVQKIKQKTLQTLINTKLA